MVRSARRVAALYDIHANLAALDAVLAEIESLQVDLIVVGGDAFWGPQPRATLDRLRELGDRAIFIRGNADRDVSPGPDPDAPTEIAETSRFCAAQLDPAQLAWLRELPLVAHVDIRGIGLVHFCHASPRSDEEILLPTSTGEVIREALGDLRGLVVCGHTHVQFDHDIGDVRLVNSGSVGLPYEDGPGAYWTLFDRGVTPMRTVYPIEPAVAAMRASGCPHAEAFFVEKLLEPWGRANALAHFQRVASDLRT